MKNKKYIIIFAICLILVGIVFIKQHFDLSRNANIIYSYTANKSDDYSVLLKQNNFYETQTLPSGGYYASKSIETFNIDLKYAFKADKKANIQYNYDIVATLIGKVNDNSDQDAEVWNRKFILHDDTSNNQENVDEISINEQVNIDYQYYNNLVRSYEKEYDITIDAILKLRFNISYTINSENIGIENEKVEDFIELDIPVTNSITKVDKEYKEQTSNSINQADANDQDILYFIGILLIIGSMLVIIVIINKNRKTQEQIYNRTLRHILKCYLDLIVTVDNEPDLTNLKIMHLSILDDLIDVAEQTQNNIIHYKVPGKQENKFYVIVNEYVYVYTL